MRTDSEILRRHQRGLNFRVVPPSDWRATLRMRANVLVTGPDDALEAFLHMARSEMREPIRSSSGPALPPFLDGVRTLILTEIDALTDADQRRLGSWFDERRHADVQVVSLTSAPLFSLVQANAFDADLYYRLNTVLLEVQTA
jgi:hypothetical protein